MVDDDEGVLTALTYGLALEGFDVSTSRTAEAALERLAQGGLDAMVLDVGLPGMSGIALVRRLRVTGDDLPVCMLSARDEVDDRVAGLAAGADDYVVKPFSIGELSARLHALVKLHRAAASARAQVGDLVVDGDRRIATRAGRELGLTAREFDLLAVFAQHPGQVLSRDQLLELVWGYSWDVESNVVDVFVGYLRRKLEAGGEPRMLHTVRGMGFVLRP